MACLTLSEAVDGKQLCCQYGIRKGYWKHTCSLHEEPDEVLPWKEESSSIQSFTLKQGDLIQRKYKEDDGSKPPDASEEHVDDILD